MPRKKREGITVSQYVENGLKDFNLYLNNYILTMITDDEQKLLQGDLKSIPQWLKVEIASSNEYKKYYYNNVLQEDYRKNNTFEDFLADVEEGNLKINFNAPLCERTDNKHIEAFCNIIIKDISIYKKIYDE